MADILTAAAKVLAMNGIKTNITNMELATSTLIQVGDLLSVTGSTDFTVNASTGELTNDNALVFTINVGDIGEVVTQIKYNTSTDTLMLIDLDSTLTITHAGEATVAAGELKVTL